MLTRSSHLVEEEGMTYMADMDADKPLVSLQAASCTCRIALGPRAGQKVLSLRTVSGRNGKTTAGLCADALGVARMQRSAIRESWLRQHDRNGSRNALRSFRATRLCRYITRPALANERLERDGAGNVVLQLKSPWRDGTAEILLTPQEFMQRLAALVPRPRLHLIRFHGVLAPNAGLRGAIV